MTTTDCVLDVRGVTVQFGGLRANEDISLDVRRGELFALIGPNGAGKTTIVNAITGVYKPLPGGTINYTDANDKTTSLIGLKQHDIVRLGVARTFQNLGLYSELSVVENLMLGRYVHRKTGLIRSGLMTRAVIKEEIEQREIAEEVIDLLNLESVRWKSAGSLPYGLQKRIEFGRVLTILLIEHDMGVVMSIADRVMVLNYGHRIAMGTPDEVQQDALVRSAYLGDS